MTEDIKFQWVNAVKGEQGPKSPTTRLVLFMLSTHMKPDGTDCFPSTTILANETRLSERCICTHLEAAEKDGWIKKNQKGITGQAWKRHEYKPLIPEKALNDVQHVKHEGTELDSVRKGKGTEPDDKKALNEVQSKLSYKLSCNISLSELLLNLILQRRNSFKKPDLVKWEEHIRLMIERDNRDPTEIERVIRWCQQDNFWQNNILSTEKLREQYDQLAMKMNSDKKWRHNEKFSDREYRGTPEDELPSWAR